jgi:hypothetical protein
MGILSDFREVLVYISPDLGTLGLDNNSDCTSVRRISDMQSSITMFWHAGDLIELRVYPHHWMIVSAASGMFLCFIMDVN